MKRFALIICFFISICGASAQNISVKSFKALPMDLTATSREGRRKDQNGEWAALIKIVTSEKGFTFEGGTLGIVDTKQENGEIWVWVSRASRKITIKHQQLGVLRDYRYPIEIEAERTYEMVLTTAKIETIIKEEVRQQYLVFELEPKNATLEVNDQLWNVDANGTALQFVDFGTYTYRVRAANYETDAGVVTVDDPDNPKTVKVKLKSNFAEVTLKVDADAEIWVNNEKKGVRTWTGALGEGTYKIECKQAGHETTMVSKDITLEINGETIILPAPMPVYGLLNVESTPSGATVFIDGKEKGKTPKSFNDLLVGQHEIRLRKDNLRDYVETIDITKDSRKLVKATLVKATPNSEDSLLITKQIFEQNKILKKKKSGSFGVKLCSGFDWISSTTGAAINEGKQMGYGIGVVAGYYFTERFAIISGVNINLNRVHYSFENASMDTIGYGIEIYSIDRYCKSTVYEVPLMLKMMTNELGNLPLRAYAQVGAGIGYAQKVKVKDDNADAWMANDKEYSNLRASLKIGTGVQYAIDESTRIFAGLYFSHDFINNISSINPNHYKFYFDAYGEEIGERETKLNLLQNRLGIEVGVLF